MPLQAVLAGLWPQLRRGSPGGSPGGAQPTQLPGPIHKGRAGAACPSVVQGAGREARRTEHSGRLRPSPTRPQAPQIRPPERTRCPAVSLSALPAGGRAEDRKGEGGGSLTPRPQAPRGAASGRRAAHKLTSSVCSPSGQTRGVQATLAPPVAMAGAACVSPAVVALSPQRKGHFCQKRSQGDGRGGARSSEERALRTGWHRASARPFPASPTVVRRPGGPVGTRPTGRTGRPGARRAEVARPARGTTCSAGGAGAAGEGGWRGGGGRGAGGGARAQGDANQSINFKLCLKAAPPSGGRPPQSARDRGAGRSREPGASEHRA
ncbi:unnamed protein product [Rangifer tarandus platyrhynchus]|uniref:Collagen alpha-1(I) chain-like n=2 Tax=Rangifer tarandus platyrhynchus TaxID=3082113 RepID=A0ABN8Y4U2_RANTA|nr:unnamed protein product [Rangifer tarandus platyrhynchus]CAI9695920.1 unnamed protein product [Rangifer tarandus platyrhynchus]